MINIEEVIKFSQKSNSGNEWNESGRNIKGIYA
jgi:hypothetical protein